MLLVGSHKVGPISFRGFAVSHEKSTFGRAICSLGLNKALDELLVWRNGNLIRFMELPKHVPTLNFHYTSISNVK